MRNGKLTRAARFMLLAFTLIVVVALTLPAAADSTYIVDSTKDKPDANIGDGICADAKGRCTLRAAIQEANANPDFDTILLPPGVFTLTRAGDDETAARGDLDITAPLEIYGVSPTATIIDGGRIDRIFDVRNDGDVTLESLTLRNGKTTGEGGCINVDAGRNLQVAYVAFSKCIANAGGAIRLVNGAALMTVATTFTGNKAKHSGGAIYAYAADQVSVFETTFKSNKAKYYGGAIHAMNGGTLEVYFSTFTANKVTSKETADGGAILADGVEADLIGLTFRDNSSTYYGGAVEIASSTGTIMDSLFEGNTAGDSGGGLYVFNSPGFSVTESAFVRNTVTGGRSVGGGVIVDGSVLAMTNTTVSGNIAGTGAGIYLYNFPGARSVGASSVRFPPILSLNFTTVARNTATVSGGGISAETGSVDISRSIVAENLAPSHADCASAGITVTTTLIGDTADCTPLGAYISGGANLDALTYLFDGFTPVHVPQAGSSALGAAPDCSDVIIDQRYALRPDTNCDIGAVQVDLRDLLKNGNFESRLKDWKFKTNSGSKIAPKAAYTGVNGLLIKGGAGALTTLKQKLPVADLQDGDTLTFGGYLSIKDNVPVNAVASITLKYSDGTTDKQSFDLETNGGMYCGCTTFGEIYVDLTGGRTVTKLVVKLKDRTTAKKYYIDYLYVAVEPAPTITRSGANGLLPPPPAPDGFRGSN